MHPESIALIFASVALSSGSQICLKLGMTSGDVQEVLRAGDTMKIAMSIATSPLVIGGLACFGLSAVLWLFVLSRIPLSSAYPFVALGILVTVLAGKLLFGETVSLEKLAGVASIVLGILLVAAGG